MTIKRVRIKKIPFFIAIMFLISLFTILILSNMTLSEEPVAEEYVNEEVSSSTLPVINSDPKPINPYVDSNVKIGKKYYDYKAEEKEQEESIIKHDDTYIQNSGIDFINDKEFEVVAVMDGTVTSIKDDSTIGKTVEIKHNDGYISIYQSLGEISVKKGDIVSQGQLIGKSGTNELDKDLGNHLHFEVYNNGQSINPSNYLKEENLEKSN